MEKVFIYPWQETQWQQFVQAKQRNRIPHAILVTGIKGLGKLRFAKQMLNTILCLHADDKGQPCGQCHSCQLLQAGNHPDHTVISPEEAGKQIKIDQIRELKEKQTLKPKVSAWKTVLITHADSLNTNAFNSLLKLLEEPQPNTILILISEQPHHLPVTIRSRCQSILMTPPISKEANVWLKTQTPQLNDDDRFRLLEMVNGAPLAVLDIQDSGLQQLQKIEADFAELMQAKANPVAIANAWQQYDLVSVMQQLQRIVSGKIREQLRENDTNQQAFSQCLWAISDCITHTIKLISSQNNLNKTLLIEEFTVSVMQHIKQNSTPSGALR